MKTSENINELAVALNKAQSEFMVAKKDAKNPFFKSKYATLNSVYEAVAPALLSNGFTIIQPIVDNNVETTLVHASGQFITSSCPIVCAKQNDPQAMGSAITYARRYSLASLLGVMTDEDDDGEKAMGRQTKQASAPEKKEPQKPVPAPTEKPKEPSLKERFENCVKFLSAQEDKSMKLEDAKTQAIVARVQGILNELQTAGFAKQFKELNDLTNSKLKKENVVEDI